MDWYVASSVPGDASRLRRELTDYLSRHADPSSDLTAAELMAAELVVQLGDTMPNDPERIRDLHQGILDFSGEFPPEEPRPYQRAVLTMLRVQGQVLDRVALHLVAPIAAYAVPQRWQSLAARRMLAFNENVDKVSEGVKRALESNRRAPSRTNRFWQNVVDENRAMVKGIVTIIAFWPDGETCHREDTDADEIVIDLTDSRERTDFERAHRMTKSADPLLPAAVLHTRNPIGLPSGRGQLPDVQ